MEPFVGTSKELVPVPKLQKLIIEFTKQPSYYFLRWTHKVSGIIEQQPTESDFPMIEGQMFNQNCELRWKLKHNNIYSLLLLSITGSHPDFKPVGNEWRLEPDNRESYAYPAYGYPSNETRYPKGFIYPESLDIRSEKQKSEKSKLAQRYFINKETSAVQFIALTLEIK
jgi:hypothetical protein